MKCPYCKEIIDDDSLWCDHCGKKLMFCPECGIPKRGTECAVCGSTLVPSLEKAEPASVSLAGDSFTIKLKAGSFGRTSGEFPEFSSCNFVSGRHGEFGKSLDGWTIMDYGSTNGTYVNGSKLAPNVPVVIKAGDTVKIATLKFTVK